MIPQNCSHRTETTEGNIKRKTLKTREIIPNQHGVHTTDYQRSIFNRINNINTTLRQFKTQINKTIRGRRGRFKQQQTEMKSQSLMCDVAFTDQKNLISWNPDKQVNSVTNAKASSVIPGELR